MGGACSRKREQGDPENEEVGIHAGPVGKLSRSISLRWPLKLTTMQKSESFTKHCGSLSTPSLLELSVQAFCQNIGRYRTLSAMPRDLTQQILNELVRHQLLAPPLLHAFLDCALQDVMLEEYPGVDDTWLDVIGTQGSSLLALDISGSAVTDAGLKALEMCNNLQTLILSSCDHISDAGLVSLTGFGNLTSLSFRSSNLITADGMRYFAHLINLKDLDLECCPRIHGGLIHLKGLIFTSL